MRPAIFLCMAVPLAAMTLSRGAWLARAPNQIMELGLLPFPIEEALLPGETKQVHLYEARFIQLFADAAAKHGSCIGMLLFAGDGACAVTSLLEVEKHQAEEYGVWAQLKCVGRVRVQDIRQTDFDYVKANVTLYHDDKEETDETDDIAAALASAVASGKGTTGEQSPSQTAAEAAAANAVASSAAASGVSKEAVIAAATEMLLTLDDQLRDTHASVTSMRRRLSGDGVATDSEVRSADTRVQWGHESLDLESERTESLESLVASRRAVLSADATTTAAAAEEPALHECVADVWAVEDDVQAERQLLSFAAVASCSPEVRTQALLTQSTTERCTMALCALREEQRRLAAMLALRGVEAGDA